MNELVSLLQDAAPVLGEAIAGPFGASALEFLASKLGASDSSVQSIKTALSGLTGDQQIKLKELDNQYQQMLIDESKKLPLAQIAVDEAEARSTNWWVAGWRPYIGWICGTGLAYQFLFMPIANGFVATHPFLPLDTGTLTTCLTGMLGLGAMRTFEKHSGVEGNR